MAPRNKTPDNDIQGNDIQGEAPKVGDATSEILEDPLKLYTVPRHDISRVELDLLKILWHRGKLSAREVHEAALDNTGWAYTTTRTTLDRMVKKGLLHRKSYHRLYLYSAAVGKVATMARLVKEFAERVLELDSLPVAALFSHSDVLNEQELAELEVALAQADWNGTDGTDDRADTTDPEERS